METKDRQRKRRGKGDKTTWLDIYIYKVNITLEWRGAKEIEVAMGANTEEGLEDRQRREECVLSPVHMTG